MTQDARGSGRILVKVTLRSTSNNSYCATYGTSLQADAEAGPEAFLDLEKALPKVLAASDDPHFKVSLAALAALQVRGACISDHQHYHNQHHHVTWIQLCNIRRCHFAMSST